MALRLPSHLHRNRYGTLYLRLTVPADLRPIIGKAEIYRSLNTASVRQAADSAQTLRIALQRLFDRLRESRENRLSEGHHEPPETLLRDVIAQLEADERKRQQEALAELLRTRKQQALIGEHEEELQQREAGHAAEIARLRTEHQRELQSIQERARAAAIAAHGAHYAPPPAPPSPPLADAIAAFIDEKMNVGKPWESKTLEKRRYWFGLFRRFMRERLGREALLSDLDKPAGRAFLDILRKLPPNITKNHSGQPLAAIATLALPPMSSASIDGQLRFLSGFAKWCMDDPAFKIDSNPFSTLKVEAKPKKNRRAFTDAEIQALLTSPAYTSRTFFHRYHYWLIPLALHTGARLGELCQLRLSDFKEVQGTVRAVRACERRIRAARARRYEVRARNRR